MNIVRLVDSEINVVWPGNIFRVSGRWPYEEYVDFMVFESQDEDRPYGLIVTSGYKSGSILVLLPYEASPAGGRGIDKDWIVSNWDVWIYPDCNVLDVYLIDRYDAVPIDGL